jgi:hypothetical protein
VEAEAHKAANNNPAMNHLSFEVVAEIISIFEKTYRR